MDPDSMQKRKRLYGTADIARLLSIDPSTVKRWADSGRLHCYRTLGGHRRFSIDQIREFVWCYNLEGIASTTTLRKEESDSVSTGIG